MQITDTRRSQRIHFVGVGGVGMSGIAEVLINLGYKVSGSDIKENANTKRLASLGAHIVYEQVAKNVDDVDLIVTSSAIKKSNHEVKAALKRCIPVVPRAQMLGELMRLQEGIAIAGTHGKTTTTSLVASLLTEGKLDPTYVIGGQLNSAGSNARLGTGQYFVAEADESDASFLFLQPRMAVVTNIDADHMQTYRGNFDVLRATFVDFLHKLPFYGLAVVCIDNPIVREILPDIARPIITYGFSEDAGARAVNFQQTGVRSSFQIVRPDRETLTIELNMPGKHNALNALAAIVIATECGVSDAAICASLNKFQGVGRRFQLYGDIKFKHGKALLVDDYGHHPNEIAATLEAVRQAWPERRLLHVFQPHRYSRTHDLFEDFARILSAPDMLLLLEIYSAGEKPITGVSGRALARSIRQRGKVDPLFVPQLEELPGVLDDVVQDGDILLLQGAGSIGSMVTQLAKRKK